MTPELTYTIICHDSSVERVTGTAAQTAVMDVMNMSAEPRVFQLGTQSAGLKLVDTYLWIFKYFMEGKELTRSLTRQVYINRYIGRMESVTLQSVAKRSKAFLDKQQEPTAEIINKQENIGIRKSRDAWHIGVNLVAILIRQVVYTQK